MRRSDKETSKLIYDALNFAVNVKLLLTELISNFKI